MTAGKNNEFLAASAQPLSPADIAFLERKKIRNWRVVSTATVLGGLFFLIWNEPTLQYTFTVAGVWLSACMLVWLSTRRTIDRNRKLVTRGEVSARFSKSEEGHSRNKSASDSYYLTVNGATIPVGKTIFDTYHRRDIVEFHYFENGEILEHRLLERAGKRHSRAGGH